MLPFGGVKQSGIGRVHGREGLMQFTQSQAYLVGEPPLAWDVATILRKPGHYQDAADIMRLAFGATLRQRLEPVLERVTRLTGRLDRRAVATAMGALGLAALVLAVSRGRKS
jgi:hypothetical protein